MKYSGVLVIDGIPNAWADSDSLEDVKKEMGHYLMIYSQDFNENTKYEVVIKENKDK